VTDHNRGMELTTARLVLRPFRADDQAALHPILADPKVGRWTEGTTSPEETSRFIARARTSETETPRRSWRLAVVRRTDDTLIGSAELQIESPENSRGSMGYLIAPAAQGHGYATEAARALLDFGLTEGGLHRITATCDPANAGSIRVLEKIGMHREGLLRDHFFLRGAWHDRLLYAVIAQLR
jgi:ribosomal-protein-alanine N-acetyltransferase